MLNINQIDLFHFDSISLMDGDKPSILIHHNRYGIWNELPKLVLGIDTFFRYRYFSIPHFDTKFMCRYFSIPDHNTHFKNRYFLIPSFDTNLRYRYLKYRYPLRYFSIPSKYLKFVQAISESKFIFLNQNQSR